MLRLSTTASIFITLAGACQGDDTIGSAGDSSTTTTAGTLGASDTGAAMTTAEESATLIMGSTSAPDLTTGDPVHHGPGACGNIGPADCTPGPDGWCADVVTLCDFLNPQNTNPGFCQDMGAICEAEHVSSCTICVILQRQCEIERDTTVDCTDYTAACGCLLDASGA
jgi:hypothetical protein